MTLPKASYFITQKGQANPTKTTIILVMHVFDKRLGYLLGYRQYVSYA
jgi:hypothetical protein